MDTAAFLFDRSDESQVALFLDLNYLAHESIVSALSRTIDHRPLFGGHDATWAFEHDREHRAIAAALGIASPPDLSVVDFADISSEDWILYHKSHHDLINQALGL